MGDNMLPAAAQTVLSMIEWRLDAIERALRAQDPGCPGLGALAAAVAKIGLTGALADELMRECEQRGYARRAAEERAGRPRGLFTVPAAR